MSSFDLTALRAEENRSALLRQAEHRRQRKEARRASKPHKFKTGPPLTERDPVLLGSHRGSRLTTNGFGYLFAVACHLYKRLRRRVPAMNTDPISPEAPGSVEGLQGASSIWIVQLGTGRCDVVSGTYSLGCEGGG